MAALLSVGISLTGLPTSTFAQSVDELPPVVVEGATLDASQPAKTGTSKSTQNTASGPAPASGATAPAKQGAQASSDDGLPLEQIGASVSVVTRKDIEERQIRYVADALRSLPGVEVSTSGTQGNLTQVRLRGAEANQTLVIIDGIEANNPTDGEFDFSNLDATDIERIEVIRGPMSGVYGSSAVGGVINIVTRGGRGPLTFRASTEGGSHGTSDFAGGFSAGNDKGYLSLNYHRRQSEGFNIAPVGDETDSWNLSTFSMRAGMTVLDTLSVNMTLCNMSKDADRDGFGGAGPLATAVDDPSKLTSDTWLAGVNVRWDTLDGHLTHEVRATRNATVTTDNDLSFPAFPFYSRNESEDIKYGYLATLRFATPGFAAHTVSGLIEHEDESFTPGGDLTDNVERSRGRESVSGEYRGDFGKTVYL
ncbi:MAG: TonB-dependent receptor plug domain-containing protein, partial [Hyphomicrobium sp.]